MFAASFSLILSEGNIHPSFPSIIHRHYYTENCKNGLPSSCHPRWSISAGSWQSILRLQSFVFLHFSSPLFLSFFFLSFALLFSLWDHQGGAKVTKYLENGRRAIMTLWVSACSFSPETNCRKPLEVAANCLLLPFSCRSTSACAHTPPHISLPVRRSYSY